MFQLSKEEKEQVVANCDHLKNLKYSHNLPYAFTEHGTVMAANVLNSKIAINTSILIVRAFIRAREIIAEQEDFKKRLEALEVKVAKGFHDNEAELQAIRYVIQQLMIEDVSKKNKPIGFR